MSEDQSSERATKYFGIDEETGEIQVLEDLKRELFENYLLSVVATDQGEPPIMASMTIVVQVIYRKNFFVWTLFVQLID